jgi:DNA-binding NarL/FixJ family response regulator
LTGEAIRVLIADDEELIRAGLRTLIDGEHDIVVVGEAVDGAEAVSLANSLRPDVVCLDIRMPNIDGIEATRVIARRQPGTGVLILTTFENDDNVYHALVAGARGFLLKRAAPASLVHAIETVHRGESLLFPHAVRGLLGTTLRAQPVGLPMLSRREGDVLRLIARGYSNAEIADELYVSLETVKTHVARILAKLEVRDRVQAVVRAYESGFLSVQTAGSPTARPKA